MRLVSMTCPNCGAQLQVDIDRTQVYCENCGTKLLMQDDVHHIVYDNAEDAGYRFEMGRLRAQEEIEKKNRQEEHVPSPWQPDSQQPEKKKRTWLWILGWIFIFPVPLTILMLRSKRWIPQIRYAIIALAWIIYIGTAIYAVEEITSDSGADSGTYTETGTQTAESTDEDPYKNLAEPDKEAGEKDEEKDEESVNAEEKARQPVESEDNEDREGREDREDRDISEGNESSESSEGSEGSTPSSGSSKDTEEVDEGGITVSFKEEMDAYEDFMNEYCDFLEHYDPSDLSMLTKYADLMAKYAVFMEKIEKIDENELTEADLAYYLEVNARILERLSKVNAGS